MNNEAMNLSNRHSLTTMLIITSEQNTQQDAIADLFIFLIRYSFLFNELASEEEILKRDFPYSGELSSQNPNGARYLDSKYSRWLSTDPALGEYVPGAGKANTKDAGGLPGMGGVFNSVNLSLFHYAGNNPVRYVDPDGRAGETSKILDSYETNISWESFAMLRDETKSKQRFKEALNSGISGILTILGFPGTVFEKSAKAGYALIGKSINFSSIINSLRQIKDDDLAALNEKLSDISDKVADITQETGVVAIVDIKMVTTRTAYNRLSSGVGGAISKVYMSRFYEDKVELMITINGQTENPITISKKIYNVDSFCNGMNFYDFSWADSYR